MRVVRNRKIGRFPPALQTEKPYSGCGERFPPGFALAWEEGGSSLWKRMSRIRFEILPPVEHPEEPIAVCGSLAELGGWDAGHALTLRWNGDLHVGTVEAEIGATFEYKLLRGNWEGEAVDAWGHVPPNEVHGVWLDATVHRTVADWKDRYAGRLTRDRVYSRALAAWRELLVWLPPSYASQPDQRYPVLYFSDGANVFDPETSPLSKVDLAADEWVRALSSQGAMPEAIIVGICHPEGFAEGMQSLREVDLSDDLGGAAYSRFLACELTAEIDGRYRTRAEADARMLGGTGLGATNAFSTVVRHEGVFGKLACLSALSPGRSGDGSMQKEIPAPVGGMRWYFDHGSIGRETELEADHRHLAAVLTANGWEEGRDYRVLRVIGGTHDERSWRWRLGDALRFLWRR